jgi:NADPH:quinone reductase-like Zn-dependent oxidoreductase
MCLCSDQSRSRFAELIVGAGSMEADRKTAMLIAGRTDMLAMRVHAFGGPDAIVAERVPIPSPGEGEVLVEVAAAGVGPWDGWIRAGRSVLPQPLPLTPGSDVSGTVAALGPGAAGLGLGAPVFGTTNPRFTDGYAEFAICKAAMIAPKPAALTFVEAASVPVIAVTAWQMLFDHARLVAGQSVLVHGAAGNVGRFAVQLAREAGLRVLASTRPEDAAELHALGADVVIGRDLAGEEQVDAALDLVGGDTQLRLLDRVRRGGALISAVSEPDAAAARARSVRAGFMLVDVRHDVLRQLAGCLERGTLRPFIGTVLPLSETVAAHRMLDGIVPTASGKIVLRVAAAVEAARSGG